MQQDLFKSIGSANDKIITAIKKPVAIEGKITNKKITK